MINKKPLFEFIPLALFVLSGIGTFFKFPYASMLVAFSGFMLSILYFRMVFIPEPESPVSQINRSIAVAVFCISITACMFSFLRWPYWREYGLISVPGMGILLIICLVNYKKNAYKPLLYRCLLFIVLLSLIYGCRSFTA